MWVMEKITIFKPGCEAKSIAVIFNEDALQNYLDEGWKVRSEWEISLLKGDDFLPSTIVEE